MNYTYTAGRVITNALRRTGLSDSYGRYGLTTISLLNLMHDAILTIYPKVIAENPGSYSVTIAVQFDGEGKAELPSLGNLQFVSAFDDGAYGKEITVMTPSEFSAMKKFMDNSASDSIVGHVKLHSDGKYYLSIAMGEALELDYAQLAPSVTYIRTPEKISVEADKTLRQTMDEYIDVPDSHGEIVVEAFIGLLENIKKSKVTTKQTEGL
jgi:hypothetical protein